MSDVWLPIQYRDFYDVPRALVVDFRGQTYLFDCPFDDEVDDYALAYDVYRLPPQLDGDLDTMSWVDLGQQGTRIGLVDVSKVVFDTTKRTAVNAQVFEFLGLD